MSILKKDIFYLNIKSYFSLFYYKRILYKEHFLLGKIISLFFFNFNFLFISYLYFNFFKLFSYFIKFTYLIKNLLFFLNNIFFKIWDFLIIKKSKFFYFNINYFYFFKSFFYKNFFYNFFIKDYKLYSKLLLKGSGFSYTKKYGKVKLSIRKKNFFKKKLNNNKNKSRYYYKKRSYKRRG